MTRLYQHYELINKLEGKSLPLTSKITVRKTLNNERTLRLLQKDGFICAYKHTKDCLIVHKKYYQGAPIIRDITPTDKSTKAAGRIKMTPLSNVYTYTAAGIARMVRRPVRKYSGPIAFVIH